MASRDSVTFAETLDHEYVALRSGTHLNFQMIKAASDVGRSLKLRMEVSSYDALCLMVQAGIGIGILPQGSIDIYAIKQAKTLALNEPWAARELTMCVRSREALSVTARLLFDHMLASEG